MVQQANGTCKPPGLSVHGKELPPCTGRAAAVFWFVDDLAVQTDAWGTPFRAFKASLAPSL